MKVTNFFQPKTSKQKDPPRVEELLFISVATIVNSLYCNLQISPSSKALDVLGLH
jgi:hypothetical protein